MAGGHTPPGVVCSRKQASIIDFFLRVDKAGAVSEDGVVSDLRAESDDLDRLVRGLGPSLAPVGVSNFLVDPMLELHDSNGALLQSNDDWADTQRAEIEATGAAPTNPKEAAIFEVLAPGDYTATMSGVNGGSGVGLVEVYKLP